MIKVIDITDPTKEEVRVVFSHKVNWDFSNCLLLDGEVYLDNYKDKVFICTREDAVEVLQNLKESCDIILEQLEEPKLSTEEELLFG